MPSAAALLFDIVEMEGIRGRRVWLFGLDRVLVLGHWGLFGRFAYLDGSGLFLFLASGFLLGVLERGRTEISRVLT